MRALLVWPKFSSFSFWNFEAVYRMVGVKYMTPPLGLLTVAALLPQDWDLRLVDENVRSLHETDLKWADVVLVSSKIVHRQRALEVIRWARELDKPVVVGGPDPTLSPTVYGRAGASSLVLNEGEVTVPMWLADFERGEAQPLYQSDDLADLTTSPTPRFDLVDPNDYLYMGLQYSRGCPYHCEFCNVIDIFQNKYRTKEPEQVLGELEALYQRGYRGQVDFLDDNLIGHMKKAKPLLREVADWLKAHKYPFQLSTSVTLNVAKDDELLDLLREARFKYFLVGIETPDENALMTAQKPHNTGFSIAEAVDRIYTRAGATVHSGFLLGLDGESSHIGDDVVKCIDDTAIPWVMAGIVYPLPGTQLSRRLDREGRLFPKARAFDDERVRDQISAGLQFKPDRHAPDVVRDLVRVLGYAFDPKGYFARCASVAVRLNTVPRLFPSWRLAWRNARTAMRLCWRATLTKTMRGPFWRAFWKVLFKNPRGMEALITLAVLFVHFQSMLPYCFEQLGRQQTEMAELGVDEWLARNLREPDAAVQEAVAEAGAAEEVRASAAA